MVNPELTNISHRGTACDRPFSGGTLWNALAKGERGGGKTHTEIYEYIVFGHLLLLIP